VLFRVAGQEGSSCASKKAVPPSIENRLLT